MGVENTKSILKQKEINKNKIPAAAEKVPKWLPRQRNKGVCPNFLQTL